MEEFIKSPTFFSVLGLILDIISVIVLFQNHGIILISGAIRNTKKTKGWFYIFTFGFCASTGWKHIFI